MRKLKFLYYIIILSVYCGLALLLFYPAIEYFHTDVPFMGNWEYVDYPWRVWWFGKSFHELNISPIETNYLLYPAGMNIFEQAGCFLKEYLLGICGGYKEPLYYSNWMTLFSVATTLFCAFIFVKGIFKKNITAFSGAFFVTFSSYYVLHLCHIHLLSCEGVFLFLLAWRKFIIKPCLKYAVFLGLSTALTFYLGFTNFTIIILWGFFYALVFMKFKKINRRHFFHLLVAVVLFFVVALPLLAPALAFFSQDESSVKGFDYDASVRVSSVGLYDVFTPPPLHRFLSNIYYLRQKANHVTFGPYQNYLGLFFLILLAVSVLKKRKESNRWLILGFIFLVLSFGPEMKLSSIGSAEKPTVFYLWGPFNLIMKIPFISGLRAPNQLVFPACVAFGIAAIHAILFILSQKSFKNIPVKRRRIVRISFLFIFTFIYLYDIAWMPPCPHSSAHISSYYEKMKKDKENYTVLDIPCEVAQLSYMLFAAYHEKPIINGFGSRTNHKVLNYQIKKHNIGEALYQNVNEYDHYKNFISRQYLQNLSKLPFDQRKTIDIREALGTQVVNEYSFADFDRVIKNLRESNVRCIILHRWIKNNRELQPFRDFFKDDKFWNKQSWYNKPVRVYSDKEIEVYQLDFKENKELK